jgi:dTDP-L-rhamnose 4-epimerase
MYEIRRYTEANVVGTASLLQALADDRGRVRKVLVAGSMSSYGEGGYRCAEHGSVVPRLRTARQLAARDWEMHCPTCGKVLEATPTTEEKPLQPTSVYAVNKRDQEEMCLAVGAGYGIPTVALRFFNVYGSRQALSNPYTGVAAIFCSRLLNANRPLVYEDGRQTRDLVHVSDVARACLLAIERATADGEVVNVGTGRAFSIRQLAVVLAEALGRPRLYPEITEKYRVGDIRHCVADISKAQTLLGYLAQVPLEGGLIELAEWVASQWATDSVDDAVRELSTKGLAR